MIEISGQEKKIEAFIEQVRTYGILELARTGRIAFGAAEIVRLRQSPAPSWELRIMPLSPSRLCKGIPSSDEKGYADACQDVL